MAASISVRVWSVSRTGPPVRHSTHSPKNRVCRPNRIRDVSGNADNRPQASSTWEGKVGNVGTVLAYGLILFYAFQLSPNQTPARDWYFVEKLVAGWSFDGTEPINPVLWSIFFVMGCIPLIFSALMVPSARSANKVPLWPFLLTSCFLGIFGLFPYLCIWQPSANSLLPPPPAEEEVESGLEAVFRRAFESRLFPTILLSSTLFLVGNAVSAGVSDWNAYLKFFDESRFVHVMSLDFCALTALLPFFMWWDADKRKWKDRELAVPLLTVVPLFGPLIYLLLRPRAKLGRSGHS